VKVALYRVERDLKRRVSKFVWQGRIASISSGSPSWALRPDLTRAPLVGPIKKVAAAKSSLAIQSHKGGPPGFEDLPVPTGYQSLPLTKLKTTRARSLRRPGHTFNSAQDFHAAARAFVFLLAAGTIQSRIVTAILAFLCSTQRITAYYLNAGASAWSEDSREAAATMILLASS
jgi:hypothetical protein